MKKKFHILFVCSGNSCRSPMAEGILRAKLPERISGAVVIESAGTLGLHGNPATTPAIIAARQKGADISAHSSQGLSSKLMRRAQMIFVMAREHLDFAVQHFPEAADKVHLLRTFGRDESSIPARHSVADPIGGSLATYRRCATIIDRELDRILPKLIDLIEDHLRNDRVPESLP